VPVVTFTAAHINCHQRLMGGLAGALLAGKLDLDVLRLVQVVFDSG